MVHEKLAQAEIHITESSGIADIKDSYGIILYIQQEDIEKAITPLKKLASWGGTSFSY